MKLLATLPLLVAVAAASVRGADLPPLNDPASSASLPGKFIWADLFTADPAAAVTFYTGVFGWTSTPINRGTHDYTVLANGDHPIAGITLGPRSARKDGSARWVGYISVADVAQTLASLKTAGGKIIVPTREVPQRGTLAIFADSEGSVLGLLHSSSGDPGDYLPESGDWAWAELFAKDSAGAAQRYRSLLGYDVVPDTRSTKENVFVLASGGYARAGLAPVPSRPDAGPGWLGFVRVSNVDETAKKAVALGGSILVAPKPGVIAERIAIIADPLGGAIGIIELSETADLKEVP